MSEGRRSSHPSHLFVALLRCSSPPLHGPRAVWPRHTRPFHQSNSQAKPSECVGGGQKRMREMPTRVFESDREGERDRQKVSIHRRRERERQGEFLGEGGRDKVLTARPGVPGSPPRCRAPRPWRSSFLRWRRLRRSSTQSRGCAGPGSTTTPQIQS
jgi:hypothetical protein